LCTHAINFLENIYWDATKQDHFAHETGVQAFLPPTPAPGGCFFWYALGN